MVRNFDLNSKTDDDVPMKFKRNAHVQEIRNRMLCGRTQLAGLRDRIRTHTLLAKSYCYLRLQAAYALCYLRLHAATYYCYLRLHADPTECVHMPPADLHTGLCLATVLECAS